MAINPERNPADLDATLRAKWEQGRDLFAARYPSLPQPFLVQCYRPHATQTAYYAQSRQPLAAVNALRKAVGLGPLTAKENARPVTWSKPGQSPHNYKPAMAFDVAFKTGNVLDYSPKLFTLFAACMVEVDPEDVVEWGGEWGKSIDRPHFERRRWRNLIQSS